MAFWQLLYQLIHTTSQCVAITQSTHSQADTQNPVVYGGSCVQAFLTALYSHGYIAWEYVTSAA
jgi:hypothetical protein